MGIPRQKHLPDLETLTSPNSAQRTQPSRHRRRKVNMSEAQSTGGGNRCSNCQHAKTFKNNTEYYLCKAPRPEPLEDEVLYVKPDEGSHCQCYAPFPVNMHLSVAIPHQ